MVPCLREHRGPLIKRSILPVHSVAVMKSTNQNGWVGANNGMGDPGQRLLQGHHHQACKELGPPGEWGVGKV